MRPWGPLLPDHSLGEHGGRPAVHGHVPRNPPAGIKPALVKDGRWVPHYQQGHGAVSRGPGSSAQRPESLLMSWDFLRCDLSLFLPLLWDSPNTPSPHAIPSPPCSTPALPSAPYPQVFPLGHQPRLSPGIRAEPWFPVQPLCQHAVGAAPAGGAAWGLVSPAGVWPAASTGSAIHPWF